MEKIVFLDFDGVIRLFAFGGGDRPEAEFSEVHIARVGDLLSRSGALLVISSTWRLRMTKEEILLTLGASFVARLHEDWATPDFSAEEKTARGREIAAWLARHPEVRRFVILDDMQAVHFGDLASNLVRSEILGGFTDTHLAAAMRLLQE